MDLPAEHPRVQLFRQAIDLYNAWDKDRKETNGVSTNGGTANLMFFDTGTFWVLPVTYCYLPKRVRAYLFPQSVKIKYFCSGPISVDPICPQPTGAGCEPPALRAGPRLLGGAALRAHAHRRRAGTHGAAAGARAAQVALRGHPAAGARLPGRAAALGGCPREARGPMIVTIMI